MIQGNESTLTGNTVAQSGIVGVPNELRPVPVDDTRPRFDEGILDAIKEGRGGVEIRQRHRFQFKTLAGKVRIDELFDCAFRKGRSIDRREISEDLAGCFVCRLIDEGL